MGLCARALAASHIFVLITLAASTVSAQQTRSRVVLSNHFFVIDDAESAEVGAAQLEQIDGMPAARYGARRYIANHAEYFELVKDTELTAAVTSQPGYNQSLEIARGFAELGLQKYKELDMPGAIQFLSRARQAFLDIRHEVVAPQEVAEVLVFLSLSYIERGDSASQALGTLRELILLAPKQPLQKGIYPDNVVAAYRDARQALIREIDRRGLPLELDNQARDLARLTGSDAVIVGFVIPSERRGGYKVRLFPWSRALERVDRSDTIELGRLDTDSVQSAGNRLAARYADCVRAPAEVPTDPVPTARGLSPMSLELSMSYATFLQFPRLRLADASDEVNLGRISYFGNYGVSVAGIYALRREFGLFTRVQILTSQRERSGGLDAREFATLRGVFGGEFRVKLGRARLGTQLGVDLTHLGDFAILDPECVPKPRVGACSDENAAEHYRDYNLLVGLNATPSIAFELTRSLEIVSKTSMSLFLFSTAEESEVNFPWSGELGFRYRF